MIFVDSLFIKFVSLFSSSRLICRVPVRPQQLYLTFDDGPHPEVTAFVLDCLKKYKAKATFFCVGENAQKYPEMLNRIKAEQHALGNHTFHHLNGWKTPVKQYAEDVNKCSEIVPSLLFRPPYGRITPFHFWKLKQAYKIVFWDVLSYDYDQQIPAADSFRHLVRSVRSGSVIVFHDSLKAENKLKTLLPKVLDYYSGRGYTFHPLQA